MYQHVVLLLRLALKSWFGKAESSCIALLNNMLIAQVFSSPSAR